MARKCGRLRLLSLSLLVSVLVLVVVVVVVVFREFTKGGLTKGGLARII